MPSNITYSNVTHRREYSAYFGTSGSHELIGYFFATGMMGFRRNLSSTEIVGQLYIARNYIRDTGNQLTNVVFMGMGEPLDNLDEVLRAIKVMLSDVGFGLGHRRVLISTIGIPDGIEKIIESGLKPKLAISLNAPDDQLRAKLMPATKKYPISLGIFSSP